MMSVTLQIRPIEPGDAEAIQRIRLLPEIRKWMWTLGTESVSSIRRKIESGEAFSYVAYDEKTGDILGYIDLAISKHMRQRHKATLSIAVDSKYHNIGIGTKLLTRVFDLADNSLMLEKISLAVMKDNYGALALYKKMDFVEEGLLKKECVRDGQYIDVIQMARFREVEK